MNRIPVGRTIAYAYGFTFGHLGVIIGLIGFPPFERGGKLLQICTMLAHLPALAGLTIAPTLFAYRALRPELTGPENLF